MTQHSCQIDDRGSSLLSYCPTRKSGSQRSHHCEPGSFRTFFISESFQGLSPKVSPKLNTLSPPKSPPRFWASPPTFLESQKMQNHLMDSAPFLYLLSHCRHNPRLPDGSTPRRFQTVPPHRSSSHTRRQYSENAMAHRYSP